MVNDDESLKIHSLFLHSTFTSNYRPYHFFPIPLLWNNFSSTFLNFFNVCFYFILLLKHQCFIYNYSFFQGGNMSSSYVCSHYYFILSAVNFSPSSRGHLSLLLRLFLPTYVLNFNSSYASTLFSLFLIFPSLLHPFLFK